MYGIYANIGGILMVNVTIYIAYIDPMGTVLENISALRNARSATCFLVFQTMESISDGRKSNLGM